MTAEQAILSLGTITLCGCGAGLVLVHGSNPLLKGLNWMGSALVFGGVGSALYVVTERWPAIDPIANLCVLAAFICCYRADRYLVGLEPKVGKFTLVLLGAQILSMLAEWAHLFAIRGSTIVLSGLMSAQLVQTARFLTGYATGRARLATISTIVAMYVVAVTSVFRGIFAIMGLLSGGPWAEPLNLISFGSFIAFGTALAFAFFWRTTTKLSVELEHMASTDPLTRVFNRRVFLQWCESEQARSLRLHSQSSLLMLDFDHFKSINDTYGHHVGDRVLIAAVERIQDSIRGIDVLCRWGGEEFAVLLPNASEESTLIVAERVRRNIGLVNSSDPRFAEETYAGLELSASIGSATFESEGDSFQLMLHRADEVLYEAKRSGRNRVVRSLRSRSSCDMASGQLALKTP